MKKILFIVTSIIIVFALIMILNLKLNHENREKIITIGILNINTGLKAVIYGFKTGMQKYKYVEGKNINYIYNSTLNMHELDGEIKSMIEKHVDMFLTISTPIAKYAKLALENKNIPIVFASVLLPVKSGIIDSLIHPGGNITGIQVGGSTEKALEWHKTILPNSKCILVPYVPNDEASKYSLANLEKAAAKLNIKLIIKQVFTSDDLKSVLETIPKEADSIWLLNSNFLVSNIKIFTDSAIRHKIPLSSGTSQYKSGVLVSYGQDPFETGIQASRLAHNILHGVSPSDLPVETADFFLGINLKTAELIGIKIPDDILQQADGIVR
ncbi:MAG: ABC transporter substrate-binding protein [Candidatus Firestonebacteria bacterium]|nr:ABC transporter substrate-binding protein [Candidatus Firestonebacteria bacterium]